MSKETNYKELADRIREILATKCGLAGINVTAKDGVVTVSGDRIPYERVEVGLDNIMDGKVSIKYDKAKSDTLDAHILCIQFNHMFTAVLTDVFGGKPVVSNLPVPDITKFPKRPRLYQPVN